MPKKSESFCVFVVGDNSTKISARDMKKELLKIKSPNLDFMVTGVLRIPEKVTMEICREEGMRLCLVPAMFAKYGAATAEQMRNAHVLDFFHPKQILIFSEIVEESSTMSHLIKLAKRKNIDVTVLRKKKPEARKLANA